MKTITTHLAGFAILTALLTGCGKKANPEGALTQVTVGWPQEAPVTAFMEFTGTVGAVRAAGQAMAGDVNLQKFVKANDLQEKFDAMNSAMALFASAMELTLASDKGKASEERIRKAAIAAAQKATKPAAEKTN